MLSHWNMALLTASEYRGLSTNNHHWHYPVRDTVVIKNRVSLKQWSITIACLRLRMDELVIYLCHRIWCQLTHEVLHLRYSRRAAPSIYFAFYFILWQLSKLSMQNDSTSTGRDFSSTAIKIIRWYLLHKSVFNFKNT